MARIVSFANQKGGVSKTTSASAFASGLKRRGYRVLVVDMDPQGNLSHSVNAGMYDVPTVYELLTRRDSAANAIQRLPVFDVIAANIMLAGAEQELSQTGKEYRLQEALEPVLRGYDYIVIDTPPSLGVLTVNAFVCSDEVIIPTTASIFAAKGIQQLSDTIESTRKYLKSGVRIRGILLTRYNPRTIVSQNIKELTEEIGRYISAPVFDTYIHHSVIVEECQANQQDIFTYKEGSKIARDYDSFIDEYLGGVGRHGKA